MMEELSYRVNRDVVFIEDTFMLKESDYSHNDNLNVSDEDCPDNVFSSAQGQNGQHASEISQNPQMSDLDSR